MADQPVPTFSAGTRFGEGGRYEVRRRIGVGGMAEVYKAVDTRLGRRAVAIKTLSAAVADHPFSAKLRALFIGEAQALSRICDDNVVNVFDFGVEDGTPYMVMEYLHGVDLGAFLKAARRLAVTEAVDLMLAVCSGVYACHLAGIIHRDLKPANIFLSETPQGRQPKLLDFGVAKTPVPSAADSERTELVVGTPRYMSPEQSAGKPANELSDQYSIGALLYRCIYGRAPEGDRSSVPDLKIAHVAGLNEVIVRVLESSPAKRFPSVHALGQALLPFASQAAQARWRRYYHEAPIRFDPNTTSSIAFTKSADPPSEAITVAADRSPSPDLTDPTIIDEPSFSSQAGVAAATTIEAVSVQSTASAIEVSRADVSLVRGGTLTAYGDRMKIIGAAAVLAALIVTVSVIADRHLGRHVEHRSALPPIVRTTDDRPTVPSAAPQAIEIGPHSLSPGEDSPPNPAAETTAIRSADVVPSRSPARSTRRARRRRGQTSSDSIEYGSDGLPILH
jgi:serine/threonine protein kinase